MAIHPTAIVEDGAILHPSVSVGPWSIVESGAVIGEGCRIESCVRVFRMARLGARNRLCHGVTLGVDPQDLGFVPERARPLTIGDDNRFREGVNVSCGVKSEDGTRIGSRNYFMSFSHVGHDSRVGDDNIFANTATLGGHVEIGDRVFLSGQVAVHQFCRVGSCVMVGGVTGVTRDVPPYALVSGHRARFVGLNAVGLRRAGFTSEQRTRIKRVYRLLYGAGLSRAEALAQIRATCPGPETDAILDFIAGGTRGLVGPARRGPFAED